MIVLVYVSQRSGALCEEELLPHGASRRLGTRHPCDAQSLERYVETCGNYRIKHRLKDEGRHTAWARSLDQEL